MGLSFLFKISVRFTTAAMLVFLVSLGAACSSMNVKTEEGLQDAEQQAAEGNSAEVADAIVEDFDEIPAELQPKAVEILSKTEGEKGLKSLEAVIQKDSTRNSPEIQSAVSKALIERNDPAAQEILSASLKENTLQLNPVIINHFASEDDPETKILFINELKENCDAGRYPEESLVALVKTEDPEAWDYVMAVAADSSHPSYPYSQKALELLAELQEKLNPSEPEESTLADIILNPGNESSSPVFYNAILSLYSSVPPEYETVKSKSVSEEIPEAAVKKRSQGSAAGRTSRGKRTDSAEKKEDTVKKETPDLKKFIPDGPDAAARRKAEKSMPMVTHLRYPLPVSATEKEIYNYRVKVLRAFLLYMGEDSAYALERRLQNALVSYSQAKHSAKARLLQSFYSQGFGTQQEESWQLMRKGLNQPMSLGMITEKVQKNYRSEPMRTYAVSMLFGIPRWQAQLLREIVAREKL